MSMLKDTDGSTVWSDGPRNNGTTMKFKMNTLSKCYQNVILLHIIGMMYSELNIDAMMLNRPFGSHLVVETDHFHSY